jgi:prolyl 4-hydroxylase
MFIYRREKALSSELCKKFIDAFEASDEKRPGVLYGPDGSSSEGDKKSTDITFNPGYLQHPTWGPLLNTLVPVLEQGKSNYIDRHSLAFSKLDPFEISSLFNLQRYEPGEGFYGWHCERASLPYSNRVLVWMIYLNTVKDRGETEFYYQHHFEPAEEGKLVIWPSDWTHLHRGVPSLTETKYVLTGWFTHIKKD